MTLLPGDIILSRSSNLGSFLIRRETMSKFSHCRVMISDTEFVEATWPRVRIGKVGEFAKQKHVVLRHKNVLTIPEQRVLVNFLLSQVGRHYGWQSVFNHLVKYRLFGASQPECSTLTAQAYYRIGKELLRRDSYLVTPQDIYQSLELTEVA